MPLIHRLSVLLALVLGGCGNTASIEGTLLEADEIRQVWVDGVADAVEVDSLGFALEGVRGDTIDLMFGEEGELAGRMRLLGLPGGAQVVLHDVWIEDELAFPTSIELEGAETVTINGLRMSAQRRLGSDVSEQATVLAISDDGERAIVRPIDDGLPDLRVVLGSAAVSSVDGEPVRATRLSYGDTVEVSGTVESGYVIAAEVTVPRSVAAGPVAHDESEERARWLAEEAEKAKEERDEKERDGDEARDEDRGGPPIRDGWPGRGRGRGRN